jgi:mercuric ion transport protein
LGQRHSPFVRFVRDRRSHDRLRRSGMWAKIMTGGGLLTALAASTCCVLPLSLTAIGVSGFSVAALTPYQTALRVAGILMLGAAFWLVYRRRSLAGSGAVCATGSTQRLTKSALWAGAVVMALVLTSAWWEPFVVTGRGPVPLRQALRCRRETSCPHGGGWLTGDQRGGSFSIPA